MYNGRVTQGAETTATRQASPLWRKMVMLGMGYFILAWVGRFLSGSNGAVVNCWLPAGWFVSGLLLNETRHWPWLMLSVVPASVLFDLLPDHHPGAAASFWFCVGDIAQAGTGAWLVRRLVAERPRLESLKEYFGLLILGGAAGAGVGATIEASLLPQLHQADSFTNTWVILWSGSMMAVLVLAPLILACSGTFPRWPKKLTPWRMLEGGLMLAGMGWVVWHVLTRSAGLSSPPALIFALWAGLRFGVRGAALTICLLTLWLAFLTAHYARGLTPAEITAGGYAFTLQVFVVRAAIAGMVSAIVLAERDRTMAQLRASEEKFSKAFRASPDGMAISELETGRYLEINEGYCRIFGFSHAEMLHHTSVELGIWTGPDDRSQMVANLKKNGVVRDWEIRMRTRQGTRKHIMLSAETIELRGRTCLVSVLHDVTARKQAEAEREQSVKREQEARIEYTIRLISAQEAERKRIAAELHDSVGQNLLLIKNLAHLAQQPALAGTIPEHLATINHLATQGIAEARRISRDLHPHQLDHLGVQRSLEAMLNHARQASDIQFTTRFESVDGLFSSEAAMNLYRIVQESVNNILKHSHAHQVQIQLERDLHEVRLTVADDGVGFDREQSQDKKGLGLKNIGERVRMLKGQLKLESAAGRGTRLEVTIPIAAETDVQ